MILHRWIFQQTSTKDKSHIPTTMSWKGSVIHCLATSCVSPHLFQLSWSYAFCFPFPFRIQIQSKHSGWSPCPSFLTSEILVPLCSMGSLAETRPAGLQRSAHSGFAWVTCWWAFGLFLVWGYWVLWVSLYKLLSSCMFCISLGEMPWGGTTGSYAWYVYF